MTTIAELAKNTRPKPQQSPDPPKPISVDRSIEFARMSPASFAIYASKGEWKPAPHLLLLNEKLLDMAERKIKRLIVSMPPRHGKSELISKYLPTWVVGALREKVILTSYEANFAGEWGTAAMELFTEHGEAVFDAKVKRQTAKSSHWETTEGGVMYTSGVGGALTGKGCQWLIIDDPVKNAEEADSPTYRQNADDWFRSTAYTRLEPNGVVIIVMCLAEGTKVLTGSGQWKPIESITDTESVYSWDGDSFKPQRVIGLTPQGYAQTLKIETDRHTVNATDRHPFLLNGKWVMAKDLKVGDRIETLACTEDNGKPMWIPELESHATDEFLWLLGFLWGDGWVTKHVRKNQNGAVSYCVCCATGVNQEENEKVKQLFKKYFGGRAYDTKFGYIRLDRNKTGRLLERLGLTPGVRAPFKKLPDWLWSVTIENKRSFIQGLLDADGCHLKNASTQRLVTSSSELAEGCHKLALTCGVRPTRPRRNDVVRQPPNSPKPIDSTYYTIDFKFEETLRPLRKHVIKRITRGLFVPTYDLSVENTENFVAEGFVVHNTRWHHDDLVGRRLASRPEGWEVIELPAIAEEYDVLGRQPGEALWARTFSA